MADTIYFQNQPLLPINNRVQPQQKSAVTQTAGNAGSFAQILDSKLSGLKFSQHALERMQSRNLNLDSAELQKLSQAVERISQKGAKESLVMMKDVAFVVSVKNKTVITAMDGNSAKNMIFTNIDSAVIL